MVSAINYLGVSKKTVEAWELGRTHPTGPANRFLIMVIQIILHLFQECRFFYRFRVVKSLAVAINPLQDFFYENNHNTMLSFIILVASLHWNKG